MKKYIVLKPFATQGGMKSELVINGDIVYGEVRVNEPKLLHLYHSKDRYYIGCIEVDKIATILILQT